MNIKHTKRFSIPALAVAVVACGLAYGQAPHSDSEVFSHVVMPQSRAFVVQPHFQPVQIESVAAQIRILERTAVTTLQISLRNPSPVRAESVLLLPVPDGAAVSSFLFEGPAAEPTARVLAKDEARATYDRIVARVRDPALLEFAGYSLIRSSVFPVEPHGTQKLRLTYEHLLTADGKRVDYVLPRTESLAVKIPWTIRVEVEARDPIAMVYSPTHALDTRRLAPNRLSLRADATDGLEPGPFLVSYLLEHAGLSASLFAYPSPEIGGGYFLLMAGLPASPDPRRETMRREVTLVIDRSGSMAGRKLEQVRAAAMRIVEGLEPGEPFNIIDYSTAVSSLYRHPIAKSRAAIEEARSYLTRLRPSGGTNIHDALLEAISQKPTPDTLPMVLFLTDGIPTIGVTSEGRIRGLVEEANIHGRRIFTFGVGTEVNAPLLDRIAETTHGTSTYVLPHEDVEVKLTRMSKQLNGPVLSDLRLETLDSWGTASTQFVRELVPERLPDLFEGDQFVLLGQYRRSEAVTFQLSASHLGRRRTFRFDFDLDSATTRNAFVPRLWASRKIAFLVDQVRQFEYEPVSPRPAGVSDPRLAELTDEILRLSTEFGILTEYSAFLATEGTDLSDWQNLQRGVGQVLDSRVRRSRSGVGAVSQSLNLSRQQKQQHLNRAHSYLDSRLERVEFSSVLQINDRAFVRRGARWIDSRLIGESAERMPDEEVLFGSVEHRRLVQELAAQGRQGAISLPGEILLEVDGRNVLIRNHDATGDLPATPGR